MYNCIYAVSLNFRQNNTSLVKQVGGRSPRIPQRIREEEKHGHDFSHIEI
jgi:hypothetical protein